MKPIAQAGFLAENTIVSCQNVVNPQQTDSGSAFQQIVVLLASLNAEQRSELRQILNDDQVFP